MSFPPNTSDEPLVETYGMLVDQALRDFGVDSFYAATVIAKARAIESKESGRTESG